MRARARGWLAVVLVSATAAAAVPAADPLPVTVALDPAVQPALAARYGAAEGAVPRACVDESLATALATRARRAPLPAGLTIDVIVTDAQPTHPARQQRHAEPAIDALRSTFVDGAALEATIRDAGGRPLATVVHRRYAPDLTTAAACGDAWADARITIREFAARVAGAVPAAAAPPAH